MTASKCAHHEHEKKIDELTRELLECKAINLNLRKCESQKSAFLDSITTSLIFVNDKLEIQWANSAAAHSVNLSIKQIVGQKCHKLRADSKIPCNGCPAVKTFKTGRTEQIIIRTPDGRIWDAKSEPVFDENGNIIGVLEIAHNVTEKKRMEKQLRQIQKMNAVAGLAGGIAHQFNNALLGIIGNIELIQITIDNEERPKKYIKSMKETVNRMANLTSQLLAYARGGKYQTQITSLNEFVKQLLTSIQTEKNPGVRIEEHVSGRNYYVKIDPTQIQMAIKAIISNAMEAIVDNGFIKIDIKQETISTEVACTNPAIKAGRFVCLSIEDDGKGMEPEVLKRVFEPFFTTNLQGRGLSMAAVYGIVENHDGWIAIGSETGKGTVVKIYFPETNELGLLHKCLKEKDAAVNRFFKTVLLVESDEMMMDVNRTMLENMGYHVLSAGTGDEAIMIAHTYEKDIDLILLDTDLPDKDYKDTFISLKKVRQNTEIIVAGYPQRSVDAQEWESVGAHHFLAKPFLKNKLKELIAVITEQSAP